MLGLSGHEIHPNKSYEHKEPVHFLCVEKYLTLCYNLTQHPLEPISPFIEEPSTAEFVMQFLYISKNKHIASFRKQLPDTPDWTETFFFFT